MRLYDCAYGKNWISAAVVAIVISGCELGLTHFEYTGPSFFIEEGFHSHAQGDDYGGYVGDSYCGKCQGKLGVMRRFQCEGNPGHVVNSAAPVDPFRCAHCGGWMNPVEVNKLEDTQGNSSYGNSSIRGVRRDSGIPSGKAGKHKR